MIRSIIEKEAYKRTALLITEFDKEDVIVTSGEISPIASPNENETDGFSRKMFQNI